MKQRNGRRFLGALTMAGIMAVGNYAFTASNTVAASAAGQGESTISGADVQQLTDILLGKVPSAPQEGEGES